MIRREGNPPALFDTGGFNERYVLLDKLQKLQVSTDDVGSVFLSHFHFDHAANCSLFGKATFYLHREEAQYIEAYGHKDLAVPVEMFPPLQAGGRLALLSGSSGKVEGIKWLATPGHTPGCLSLLLEYQGRHWVLASDAVKNRFELLTGTAAMTVDPEKSQRSIDAVRTWADFVVPGHDTLLAVDRGRGQVQVKEVSPAVVEVIVPASDKNQTRSYVLSTDGL